MRMSRNVLLSALTTVQPGLQEGLNFAHADELRLTGESVITYNDEVYVEVPLRTAFSGVVRAEELLRLIRSVEDERIDLRADGGFLAVMGRRFRAASRMRVEKTPLPAPLRAPIRWFPLPVGFIEALKCCRFTASKDQSSTLQTSVHINGRIVESHNKFHATRCSLANEAEAFRGQRVLFPARNIVHLSKHNFVEMGQTNGFAHFRRDGIHLACRMFIGTYDDLDSYFGCKGVEVEFPEQLGMTLDRALAFSQRERIKTITHVHADIRLAKNRATVVTENWCGWFMERVEMAYSGPALTFRIDLQMLKDAMLHSRKGTLSQKVLELRGDNHSSVIGLLSRPDDGRK